MVRHNCHGLSISTRQLLLALFYLIEKIQYTLKSLLVPKLVYAFWTLHPVSCDAAPLICDMYHELHGQSKAKGAGFCPYVYALSQCRGKI